MAKGLRITVGGVQKKGKKLLLTKDGVYKKVKKAYSTIGGVWRPFWSGGELAYYGTVTSLYAGYKYSPTESAKLSSRAFFSCGDYVNHYNTSLTKGYTSLSLSRGASNPSYACFAVLSTNTSDAITAFNASATKTTATAMSEKKQQGFAGAGVGNYALFSGGSTGSLSAVTNAYNTSLTRSIPTALSMARAQLGGASVGNYALFAGGWRYEEQFAGYDDEDNEVYEDVETNQNRVDTYNTSLTRSTATALSIVCSELVSASSPNYACFLGYDWDSEVDSGVSSSVIPASRRLNIYNASLTRTIANLTTSRFRPAMAFLESYLLVGGGNDPGNADTYNTVEVFDSSFTKLSDMNIGTACYGLAAEQIGNYALFAGGISRNSSAASAVKTVSAFTVA